ncbi:hypothetical protein Q5P01_011572 [Channa striata]|uniref:Ig-like domain-containing protein n=1 Tax=Channa striata TaxID=64152 RepID=A0AA88MWK9_CHASR|nr:hypothetical protein Q5P01_011572 [Channa striata]
MTCLGCGRSSTYFFTFLLSFTFQAAPAELLVSPVGAAGLNAAAGSSVTLAVSFSGAPDPVVTWFMGRLHVVTWTLNSGAPPDIAENLRKVIRLEPNGSLTFANVTPDYTNNYTVEMTKPGLSRAVTGFTLRVFELIQDVVLSARPAFAQEGADQLTLQYELLRGIVEQQTWFFRGTELKTSSHYLVEQRSLVILRPNRSDTGWYTLVLTNPFSNVTSQINVAVLYGPDEPVLEARPAQPFYVSGDSLSLSCHAEGLPQPTARWDFGGQTLFASHNGVLNLTNVRTGQGGVYTCTLLNKQTAVQRQKNMTLYVYERPSGNPMCSVQSVTNTSLQYLCQWPGGSPQAQLSFPALNTSSGAGSLSWIVTVTPTDNLSGRTFTCIANHPVEQNTCNITARSPVEFLPAVTTTVDSEDKIVVTIHCVSDASPRAVVSWTKGSEAIASGTVHQISSDTTQLQVRDSNVSNFLLQNYTCTCSNPLGIQRRETLLQGPSISDSNVLPNKDGTIVTLTWEIPPTSVVTGFNIEMLGPDLLNNSGSQTTGSSNTYRTIQQKPGTARSTDVFALNPRLTYQFRVMPKAGVTVGEPSVAHRIGPGTGLSGPAVAGIAAGIPCGLLFLFLIGGLIYLYTRHNKNKSRQTRYPVSRAVEKTKSTQSDVAPNHPAAGRLKSPPDYNRLQQTPSERSVALPTFTPPPPVRVATTV